jgi:hypothetical protein
MLRTLSFIFLCTLVSISAYADEKLGDSLIVQGERVGLVTKDSTETTLKKLFPADQVKRVWADVGEGEYSCNTKIFPNSDKALTITWANSAAENEEKCMSIPTLSHAVSVQPVTAYWHTKEGIGVGSSLAELEKANNAPITFMACECCGDGGVITLNRGKLSGARYKDYGYTEMVDGTKQDISSVLEISLNHRFTEEGASTDIASYNKDGGVISTDLPQKIKNAIRIVSMTVYLEKDASAPQ